MVVISINSTRYKGKSTLEGTETEKKQSQNYIGRFARPDVAGRKYEPIFIGIK